MVYSGQSNLEYEHLGEFETKFENILGYKSWDHEGLIDGKNERSTISYHCPFKLFFSRNVTPQVLASSADRSAHPPPPPSICGEMGPIILINIIIYSSPNHKCTTVVYILPSSFRRIKNHIYLLLYILFWQGNAAVAHGIQLYIEGDDNR
jgi:hypothetical protein